MYEAFYGLTEKPFNLTPDPRFLFLSEKHKEAFAHLLFGIKNRSGFVMVSGEIGTGKTTICRTLLNQLEGDTEIAFIFNPMLSPEELLQKINEDFGIESKARTVKELIDELNEYLLEQATKGKNCVLVIDEAQDLTPALLEQIRLLSNLETETQKLIQIILIGQPELAEKLHLPELRQLNQRITARYHLKMLNPRETAQYINHRLRVAGGRKKLRFTRGAIRAIFRASSGTPRVINALCDRALLIGYTLETRDITPGIIRRALREIRGEPIGHGLFRQAPLWRRMLSMGALLALLAVGMSGYYLWYTERINPSHAAPFASGSADVSKETKALLVNLAGALANAEKHIEEMSAAQKAEIEAAKAVAPAAQPTPSETPTQTPAAEAVRTTFADWALTQDPAASLKTGIETLLGLWGTPSASAQPANDSPEALATTGRLQGLSAEVLSPALDQLLALNLPAMVRFKFAEKTIWAAVTELWEDGVLLKTPGESYKLSRGDFRDCYDGVAVVFWRDPAHDDPILKLGTTGNLVSNLQKRLQKLDRFPGKITGHYEQDTANAIARIQAETGLKVDALAGTQVRMILSAWLPKKGTPLLNPKLAHTPPEDELPTTPTPEPAPAPVIEPAPVVAPPPAPEPPTPEPPTPPAPEPAAPEQQPPQEQPAPPEKIAPTPEQAPTTNPAAYSDALDKSMPVPASEKAPVMWGLEAPSVKSEDIPAAGVSSLPPASIDSSKEVTLPSVGSVPFLPRGGDAVETNGKQP